MFKYNSLLIGFMSIVFVFNPMLIGVGLCEEPEVQTPQKILKLSVINKDSQPADLLEIIEHDWEINFEADTTKQEKLLMNAVLGHIIQAADLIIANPNADGKTAVVAVRNKMQALGVLSRTGNTKAALQAVAMAQELQHDKRPLVAREGKLIVHSNRLSEIPRMNQQQRTAFVSDLIALFSEGKITEREIQIAKITGHLFEQVKQYQSAQHIFQETAELLSKTKSPELKQTATEFFGAARRMGLPGRPMKLTGKTLAGEDFDVKDLKGKVVLVQFWASWCNFCLQEMPNIMKQYHLYHDQGFEVIGVSMDDSADRAREIVDDMQLPWPQLFSTKIDALGIKNPNAVYYGVSSIPLCILIDQKGNVVSLKAEGKILNQELERLFIESKSK